MADRIANGSICVVFEKIFFNKNVVRVTSLEQDKMQQIS